MIIEINSIIVAQRKYLKQHKLPKKSSWFIEEMKNVKNIGYFTKNDIYADVDKEGLQYIELGGYIIRLKIVKINGKPKILDIFLLKD